MEKKEILISDVLKLLKVDGMTHAEINKHYGLNKKSANLLWQHEKLKGLRKSKQTIEIIDDICESKNPPFNNINEPINNSDKCLTIQTVQND